MSRGDNGNAVAGDVNAKGQTAFISLRKVACNQVSGLMTDIEKDAVCAESFHLKIDGSGHNITWCQLFTVIEVGNESLSIWQMQGRPLAAECLGHQK